jgi:hypothetical protein
MNSNNEKYYETLKLMGEVHEEIIKGKLKHIFKLIL